MMRSNRSAGTPHFSRGPVFALLVCAAFFLGACSGASGERKVDVLPAITPTVTQFIFPPTYTPTPPLPATKTPTPLPSRTPLPTPTLASTAAPSATPLFSIALASLTDQPFITANLLFLKEGRLLIWPQAGLELQVLGEGVLPEGIIRYSSSTGAAVLAILTESGDGYEVSIYNRFLDEITRTFEIEAAEVLEFALSPDGTELVFSAVPFVMPVVSPTPQPSPTAPMAPTSTPVFTPTATAGPVNPQPDPEETMLYWLDLTIPGVPVEAAACGGACAGLLWDSATQTFVWGQRDGLYRADPGASGLDITRVLEPFLSSISGSAAGSDSYLPVSISPSGRYLMVRKGLATGSVLAVVDLISGQVENIPGTGEYAGAGTGITWLAGDLLFIARPGVPRLELLPAGEIWSVVPGGGDSMFAQVVETIFPGDTGTIPDAPVQLADGRIGFTLNNFRDPGNPIMNGVFILDPGSLLVEKVNHLPTVRAEELLWLPDGAGAVLESASRLLYIPTGFGQIYTLTTLFGNEACCFQWIP